MFLSKYERRIWQLPVFEKKVNVISYELSSCKFYSRKFRISK